MYGILVTFHTNLTKLGMPAYFIAEEIGLGVK